MTKVYAKITLPEIIEKTIPGKRYVAWRRNRYIYVERNLRADDKGDFIKYKGQKVYVHQDGVNWRGRLRPTIT